MCVTLSYYNRIIERELAGIIYSRRAAEFYGTASLKIRVFRENSFSLGSMFSGDE